MEYDVLVQNPTFGLGCVPSPPDERDYPLSALYFAAGVTPQLALPVSYRVPNNPPILNQGTTPQCVAFSTSAMKAWQDYNDPIPDKWWDFDESLFFNRIGGTSYGAFLRNGLQELKDIGYPVAGNAGLASQHKVRAYYAVPVQVEDIKDAIYNFGEVVFGTRWFNSWFTTINGTLPPPDSAAGGHAIRCVGWNDAKGFLLANSWGTTWGTDGYCWLPYRYLDKVFEVWKAIDQEIPASPVLHRWHVKSGTTVFWYNVDAAGVIQRGISSAVWATADSSAACSRVVARKAYTGKIVNTTKVLSGKYIGKHVRVLAPGSTVT